MDLNTKGMRDAAEHLDVLIVGAGLSGICAAYHLQKRLPHKRIAILEGRAAIGGTWDLFRYPGVRSDSDMFTLGYSFRNWRSRQSIVDGGAIRQYICDTAAEFRITEKIRFRHRVTSAAWDSASARWTIDAQVGADPNAESNAESNADPNAESRSASSAEHVVRQASTAVRLSCDFLFMCSGYYDYQAGYLPSWPGLDTFGGTFIHPQHWPAELDVSGRRVVVIGSGATAVTLVPALAAEAAHVTMLQRSPTYIVARPAQDGVAGWLQRWLPATAAGTAIRWKNILLGTYFFGLARRKPDLTKRMILKGVRMHLGSGLDERDYTPPYDPWDQRLCLVPDADFFKAVRAGTASVVTDEIADFTATGLRLRSGRQLDADIVVAATGLKVQLFGGMRITVDGVSQDVSQALAYKGMMYSGIPNLASAFGYTNASWTLKCELTAKYVSRLLQYMDARDFQSCTPQRQPGDAGEKPACDLSSGYILRAATVLPKQGLKQPWQTHQNYFKDLLSLKFARLDDGVMQFGRRASPLPPGVALESAGVTARMHA